MSNVLKLEINKETTFEFVKLETVATAASEIPHENRRAGVQERWHVCNKCKYPVTFGFISLEAAKVIAEQKVPGISFIKYDLSIFNEKGINAVFCRDCYTQTGYKKMNGRKFKKMSDAWTKKQNRGF